MMFCTTCKVSWGDSATECPRDGTLLVHQSGSDFRTSGQLAMLPAPIEELAAGTVVGGYEIEGLIGSGGMGRVYGARHPLIGKRAAIKVLHSHCCADANAVVRFVHEAQAVNRIGHANIVDIFAFGALDDGRSYLIMEWLQGETLQERLERVQRIQFDEVVSILVALTRALEAAHAAGVIHRDLKPDNVILIHEDDTDRLKLLDFGIAKLSTTQPSARRTETGMTMGTPLFMSPEQARGLDVDASTDLYALGVIGYAMICGQTPFEHEGSPVEILHAHISKPPVSPSAFAPDIPEGLESLLLELLSKQPAERPRLSDVRLRLRHLTSPSSSGSRRFASEPALAAIPFDARPVTTDHVPAPDARTWIRFLPGFALVVAVSFAVVVVIAVMSPKPETGLDAIHAPVIAVAPPVAPSVAMTPVVTNDQPPAVPLTGTVELAINPPTAALMIDGKPVSLELGRAQLQLEPGKHVAAVRANRFHPLDKTFVVVASKTTSVELRMSRSAPRRTLEADGVVNPFASRKR